MSRFLLLVSVIYCIFLHDQAFAQHRDAPTAESVVTQIQDTAALRTNIVTKVSVPLTVTQKPSVVPGPKRAAKNAHSMFAAVEMDTAVPQSYYESWAPYKRGACTSHPRPPSWIKTDSITHLNVAFGYIQPSTFEVSPDLSSEEILLEIMDLKEKAPGLKIYISLGGWTYSDNDTDTQPVWGDLASSSQKRQKFIGNLANFMGKLLPAISEATPNRNSTVHYGFDGVDLDWEYPGAPDRGGEDRDIDNFVDLVRDIRDYWTVNGQGWGLSFTAPTSYWYMRWFDVEALSKYVDWINLMTYDLHGSWDSPEDQIGSYVYAHTNLTEIQHALDLLWRNNVPANKVNLGLGFYGRSYTLQDPSCTLPGCPFTEGGRAGACTGESGILSFQEISDLVDKNIKPVRDDKAGAMYVAFDQDQWVSYDNVQTIKEKVDFANKNGLLGLFIWALDLDNDNYDALAAVLDSRGGLGTFGEQNGVGPSNDTTWQPEDGNCYLSACSTTSSCKGGTQTVGSKVPCDKDGEFRWACCPRGAAPDAKSCTWKSSFSDAPSPACTDHCSSDEVEIVQSQWYVGDDGKNKKCFSGYAQYCCKAKTDVAKSCGKMDNKCIGIGKDGKPTDGDPCAEIGRRFITYSQDTCPDNSWRPWCCDSDYEQASQCSWKGPAGDEWPSTDCENAVSCDSGKINLGVSKKGGGTDCSHKWLAKPPANPNYGIGHPMQLQRALCCPQGDNVEYEKKAPVPLAWLFPDEVKESDKVDWDLDVNSGPGGDGDPDENKFGWVIMAGPEKDVATLDKRDGSHWELFDCPERSAMHEDGQYKVRALCTDDSEDSNCYSLFLGQVARTVVEMPHTCGLARHAMAVSMEPAENQTLPSYLVRRLVKRGTNLQSRPQVYDFVFDYDFSVLHSRSDSEVQIRIDYSEDPHYWKAFVDHENQDTSPVRKRDLELEVEMNHGGSWKRYAEHVYHQERRKTLRGAKHKLKPRLVSGVLSVWMIGMAALNNKEFKQEVDLPGQHVKDTFPFYIFSEDLKCKVGGIPFNAYCRIWADLHLDIQTSAQLTLIGRLDNLESWKQSHVLFRNKGSIQAGLHMSALAQLRFSTGPLEIFGMANFGSAFKVPGLVTIGPNLRVMGVSEFLGILQEVIGVFTVHADAHYDLEVSAWDYTQRYPNPDNDVKSGLTQESKMDKLPTSEPDADNKPFRADVGIDGDLTFKVTPLVEFGIRWNQKYKVQDTVLSLQLNTYATFFGSAGVGTDTAASVCYGAVCGVDLFAQLEGP
ncbi:glycoside hydrolase family 18 protein [Apiospora saccharicola]